MTVGARDADEARSELNMFVGTWTIKGSEDTYREVVVWLPGGGTQRSLRGTLIDGVWRFFGQSERGPNWRRYLATISASAEGYSFVEEVSDRGGPWRISVERTFLRLE